MIYNPKFIFSTAVGEAQKKANSCHVSYQVETSSKDFPEGEGKKTDISFFFLQLVSSFSVTIIGLWKILNSVLIDRHLCEDFMEPVFRAGSFKG